VNTQGKYVVVPYEKNNALRGNNVIDSPLVKRANTYFGRPEWTNYTIEADCIGSQVEKELPDMGVVANRYRLVLFGNLQRLRIDSWDAIPRVAVDTNFEIKPKVWYRLKLKVQVEGKTAKLYGKAWERSQPEPKDWQLTFTDTNPNTEGSPAVYRYCTGILEDRPGTEVYFDNVKVTPN
jgi:hypothetical protein